MLKCQGWVEQHNDRSRSEAVFVGDRTGSLEIERETVDSRLFDFKCVCVCVCAFFKQRVRNPPRVEGRSDPVSEFTSLGDISCSTGSKFAYTYAHTRIMHLQVRVMAWVFLFCPQPGLFFSQIFSSCAPRPSPGLGFLRVFSQSVPGARLCRVTLLCPTPDPRGSPRAS